MHQLYNYDLYIFDCDGVIFDSNYLKIDAMKNTLSAYPADKVDKCIKYFSVNFGKSRYHHIEYFLENFLHKDEPYPKDQYEKLISIYSAECKKLYLKTKVSPGFINFIKKLNALKFVASGSDEKELIEVFYQKAIGDLFHGIYGSPEKKSNNIKKILQDNRHKNVVMIGDAFSDLEAAEENGIDFVFYSPYSNVRKEMTNLCEQKKYRIIESFEEV